MPVCGLAAVDGEVPAAFGEPDERADVALGRSRWPARVSLHASESSSKPKGSSRNPRYASRPQQALDVLAQAEDGGPARGAVAADALEGGHAVVERRREEVEARLRGRDESPVEPDARFDLARSPRLSRVLAQPAHHLAQPAAHFLDGMAAALLAQLVEDRPARLVLQDPLAGERRRSGSRGGSSSSPRARLSLMTRGPRRVVAVLGGVADRVAHPAEAALVHHVDDQLQLVQALEVRALRLVAGLDQRLEAGLARAPVTPPQSTVCSPKRSVSVSS